MSAPLSVVINCAGTGRRLGLGQTKALVEVLGRSIIEWQLDLLGDVEDVRVVVGYNASQVIDRVIALRRDAMIVFNHDYERTATGNSLLLAARHVHGDVVSLDGDLLIPPADFDRLLRSPASCLGVTETRTDDAVFAILDSHRASVVSFSRVITSAYEWTGLVKVPARYLSESEHPPSQPINVFELVAPLLPMPALCIDTCEIDTPNDYERAVEWMKARCLDGGWRR